MKLRSKWTDLFSVLLFVYTSITLFILCVTIMNAFKSSSELSANLFGFPKEFIVDNFRSVMSDRYFLRQVLNSVVTTFLGTGLLLLLSAMAGYGLAKFTFKGNRFLSGYFMIGMMFPIQLCVMPLFIILRSIGLLDSLWGIILLYASGLSFPLFTFTNFFQSISPSIAESARIDGAGEFRIFFLLIVPICKPVFATMALINGIKIWNDFYTPMVFLTSVKNRTLMLSVYRYMQDFVKNWDLTFAAVVLTLLPIAVLYILCSKQIMGGLTAGSDKE
ncbi:carbohydrate ABC transporter permease [Enterococcus casseliflavus]|uniref:carbohydrate ABC transporter permease n=1 Tax=Enterococcus casseliflavus TaxID=37734 RepID=UPI001157A7F7|nr:carbohydrate ABC transporter permease [Enterococcus casseliflavus]NKD28200.1 carbohydrate ABC transporter permease [Enterococcus casseliflavus]